MTRKGIVLSIILIVLLLIIITMVSIQSSISKKSIDNNINSDKEIFKSEDKSLLYITDEDGFDLEKLKSYKLPIIIQIGSSDNETYLKMNEDLEELNDEVKGKAIIRILDIKKYQKLLNDESRWPIQLLFNSRGKPYETEESVASGYRIIKDDNRKSSLHYT